MCGHVVVVVITLALATFISPTLGTPSTSFCPKLAQFRPLTPGVLPRVQAALSEVSFSSSTPIFKFYWDTRSTRRCKTCSCNLARWASRRSLCWTRIYSGVGDMAMLTRHVLPHLIKLLILLLVWSTVNKETSRWVEHHLPHRFDFESLLRTLALQSPRRGNFSPNCNNN